MGIDPRKNHGNGFNDMVIPIVNAEIMKEYRDVLSRPKFHFPDDIVKDIADGITSAAIFLDAEKLEVELPDPKDRVFYEVVMEARKDEDAYLVTGNMKHFPQKPFILIPREMLEIVLNQTDAVDNSE